MSDAPDRGIAIALSLVVAVVVGVGLYLSGSPTTAREEAIDRRRVEALRDTRVGVNAYFRRHRLLPPVLDSLSPVAADSATYRDPMSGAPYEYRAVSDSVYELCAVFSHESSRKADLDWSHPSGRHCFTLLASQPY